MKKENAIGRKEFLASLFAASAGCAMDRNASARRFDDSLSVLLSDVHIGKPAPGCMHQIEFLNAVADEILSLDPPPKRVVGFGDLSILDGLECDYETSRRIFRRLADAGIEVFNGLGNPTDIASKSKQCALIAADNRKGNLCRFALPT